MDEELLPPDLGERLAIEDEGETAGFGEEHVYLPADPFAELPILEEYAIRCLGASGRRPDIKGDR